MNQRTGFTETKPDHHYRAEIPNCVDDAGLDCYEYRVYGHIKRMASDDGICFQSVKNIALHCKISERKVTDILSGLCLVNKFLGLPLLKKTMRKKENGSYDTCIYEIIDVWHLNKFIYSKEKIGGECHAPGVVHNMHQGGAPRADKEEPIKKNPIKKDDDDLNKPASNPKKGKADASHHQRQSQIKIKEDKSFFSIQKADYETLRKCFHEIREADFNDQLMRCFNKVIFEGIHRVCYKKYIHNWFQNYLREKK